MTSWTTQIERFTPACFTTFVLSSLRRSMNFCYFKSLQYIYIFHSIPSFHMWLLFTLSRVFLTKAALSTTLDQDLPIGKRRVRARPEPKRAYWHRLSHQNGTIFATVQFLAINLACWTVLFERSIRRWGEPRWTQYSASTKPDNNLTRHIRVVSSATLGND